MILIFHHNIFLKLKPPILQLNQQLKFSHNKCEYFFAYFFNFLLKLILFELFIETCFMDCFILFIFIENITVD